MSKPIPEEEPPLCSYCKIQPLPESTQYLPFIVLEMLLLFYNPKISLCLLFIGYSFSKTVWICPMCKRTINDPNNAQPDSNHIIIRLSDCMVILSKSKFRIISLIAIALLSYSVLTEPVHKPRIPIEKSWRSIATNCGYEMHVENSIKANHIYEMYEGSGSWTLDNAIFLGFQQKIISEGYSTLRVKMNPTQFRDVETEDIHVLTKEYPANLQKGDGLKLVGEWSGKREHVLLFVSETVQKNGKRYEDLSKIEALTKGLLRQHSQ